MSTAEDTRLRGATRWSMAARCPRQAVYAFQGQAVYAFQGIDPRPPDDETLLLFERGKLDEQWVVEQILIPRYGRENLLLQKAVPWPAPPALPVGELHTDVFVLPEALDEKTLRATGGKGLPIEIKSHFAGEPSDSDFRQLRGQIHHDPDAGNAGVLIIVDRNLHRDELPVLLHPEHAAEIDALTDAVVAATRDPNLLPSRPCAKPSDGVGRLCPFITHCFDGWQPDPADETEQLDLETFTPLALEALAAKRIRDDAKRLFEQRDGEWKQTVAALDQAGAPTGKSTVAGIEISRSPRKGRETFSLATARKAGAWLPVDDERFGAFVKVGEPYDVWDVKQSGELSADDFGEVPF